LGRTNFKWWFMGSQNFNGWPWFFKKFKRAVAFDRKQMGSVVTRQKQLLFC
jgi:hypothetical protein